MMERTAPAAAIICPLSHELDESIGFVSFTVPNCLYQPLSACFKSFESSCTCDFWRYRCPSCQIGLRTTICSRGGSKGWGASSSFRPRPALYSPPDGGISRVVVDILVELVCKFFALIHQRINSRFDFLQAESSYKRGTYKDYCAGVPTHRNYQE
ncbi:hypothetical protein BC834DRAFT_353061 [Gloeopeniophorella convolvens]|nr:hypothetical protein BC834DRAFT_353061 [Gloeopeniophorella convolvens]